MEISTEDIRALQSSYKEKIVAGIVQRSPQIFIGSVGLVGAGKTTVMKPLAERLQCVRISSDEIRETLKEKGYGYDMLMEIIKPIAVELAQSGYSIVFDMDCGNPRTKTLIEDLATEISVKIFWIHINPPEEFILNKLRTYNHTWLFKDGEEAVANYFAQKEKRRQENTHFDFFAEIDTSTEHRDKDIEHLVSKIIIDQ